MADWLKITSLQLGLVGCVALSARGRTAELEAVMKARRLQPRATVQDYGAAGVNVVDGDCENGGGSGR